MAKNLASIPQAAFVGSSNLRLTAQAFRWLGDLVLRVTRTPERVVRTSLTGQAASIAATALSILSVVRGLYRVAVYVRVTTPAGTSSSVTVTIAWTDGGVACSHSFSAVTGNLETSVGGGEIIIRADEDSEITYAVVYSSSGTPAMAYRLDLSCEALALEEAA